MKKIIFTVFVYTFIIAVTAGVTAVSYTLRVVDQQADGTNFTFKLYLQSTNVDFYLADSDIYLSFNSENFSSPVLTKIENGDLYSSAYTVSPAITGDKIAISIKGPAPTSDTEFQNGAYLLSTDSPGTYIGKFQISGINNPAGTAGLAWYYPGTSGTDLFYFGCQDPWPTFRSTTYANEDPANAALPVNIAGLSAVLTDNNYVVIKWTTKSEIRNLGFNVLRSTSDNGPWYKLNSELIKGAGTTVNENQYEYLDKVPRENGIYFYKIEQIDTDGKISYFGPVQLDVGSTIPKSFSLQQNYPNPFNPFTNIIYALPEESDVRIRIFNMRGELVNVLVNQKQNAGTYKLTWDGTSENGHVLSSGLYFIKIDAGKFSDIKKMIFAK
ncbi:T9SS type A sorting domain-containing protein [candidate division KSB1 bacterium]|nr:T9SS type A sorting domain-containing protein [candidate division KSB1 bacterium]